MSMIGNYLRVSAKQLEEIHREPSGIMNLLYPKGETDHATGTHLDIDKAWHAIQFLLTGEPWGGPPPLQNAVLGGTELGDEDVGYGPARALAPDEVQAVSIALAAIPSEQLWSRFDAKKFVEAEIYPQGLSSDDRDYILQHYDALRAFFSDAARSGDAIILYLN
jgi:hypothetical protein